MHVPLSGRPSAGQVRLLQTKTLDLLVTTMSLMTSKPLRFVMNIVFFGKTLKQHFFKMEAEMFKILDKKIGPSSKPGARMFQARSGMGIEG